MNDTSKIGSDYEDKVFELAKGLISGNDLPFEKDGCVFHRKKSYHSPDRGAKIEFENVIECFARGVNPSSGQPTIVIIFECKSYGSLVDVSEVEEFGAKLQQIRGFQKKGYMVTRKGFRKSALTYAQSNGIGLIRFVPKEQVTFLMYHMTSMNMVDREFVTSALDGLTTPHHVAHNQNEYGFDRGRVYGSAQQMISSFVREQLPAD